MNHLNIIQYIISMKHKSIRLMFSKSILYTNIKNLMAKFGGGNSLSFQKPDV